MFISYFTDRVANKCRLYNFEQVGEERAWLKDVLLSDSSSNDSTVDINGEETVNELLYLHQLKKKYQEKFYKNPKVIHWLLATKNFY